MLPALRGHRALARSFPSCLSPHVFPSTQLWAGSLGICIKTQRKRIVLFLTYKSTLLILTPTVPSPVLTSGEPLALRVFVSRPKTATAGKGGKILETKEQVCAVSQCTNPLVIQQAREGAQEEDTGKCRDILGKTLHLCFHIVSICGGKQEADDMGCRQGVRVVSY